MVVMMRTSTLGDVILNAGDLYIDVTSSGQYYNIFHPGTHG